MAEIIAFEARPAKVAAGLRVSVDVATVQRLLVLHERIDAQHTELQTMLIALLDMIEFQARQQRAKEKRDAERKRSPRRRVARPAASDCGSAS